MTDADGCVGHVCDEVDTGATCDDVAAPGVGYTCSCTTGYSELEGMCQGRSIFLHSQSGGCAFDCGCDCGLWLSGDVMLVVSMACTLVACDLMNTFLPLS